jgi:hypothetical protein
MVRTGRRADELRRLLLAEGLRDSETIPPRPQLTDLPNVLADEMLAVYRRLGGIQPEPVLRPGGWDLAFHGALVVELDEELHFNRYRALTLSASWSSALPWRGTYDDYCDAEEQVCLSAGSWGKRWTNASCERMFGQAGPAGELDGAGAPRWKQRAMYDALKDVTPSIVSRVRMSRVSVHDTVEGHRLWDILEGAAAASHGAVRALVESRIA